MVIIKPSEKLVMVTIVFNVMIQHIQDENKLSNYFLKEHGYKGSAFKS